MKNYKILAVIILMTGSAFLTGATEPGTLLLNAKYVFYNNEIPFVQVQTRTKVNKKLQPVEGITVQLYLDSLTDNYSIGKVKTSSTGNATVAIPKELKAQWDASPVHTIYCTSAATKAFEEAEQEVMITRAKLQLDTLNDGATKTITATLMEMTGPDAWKPVLETDVIIGVKRLGGILSAGTDATYMTNEEGIAEAMLERENLPGDAKGNLTLIAKVEDNDLYGNLVTEIKAPWGVPLVTAGENFYKRALWGTSDRAPVWLILMANAIIIMVWGVLIYLAVIIFRIRKLGLGKE